MSAGGGRLDPARARALMEEARRAAPAEASLELTVEESNSELTRFANNAIHQHVAESSLVVSVRAQLEQRTARASSHRLDGAGMRELVDRAVRLTRSQAADPDLLPMASGAEAGAPAAGLGDGARFDAATAALLPGERADAVAAMVGAARAADLTAAGICASRHTNTALLNTNGVEVFHAATGAEFSVTAMGGNSSGWAKGGSFAWSDLDPAAGARAAVAKARASENAIEEPAAKLTVILEPAAVLDLLGFIMWDFGALSVLDQRSFLCERIGTKLFGDNVTITDDIAHPLQTGSPFDGEGMARQRVQLVENGWVRNLVYARQTAARAGARATGHGFPLPNEYGEGPINVVFAGGETPVEEMIASTERGILVTRLWYIREVDPYQKILTGMTRDGTFLIEGGRVAAGVRNFRFNQSMIALLNQIEASSPSVRASGEESFDMVVPALKVREFNFTEVTRF